MVKLLFYNNILLDLEGGFLGGIKLYLAVKILQYPAKSHAERGFG
ncbi:MAG: hypothetical protein Q4B79_04055 [Moraxella sp.]|nr:hypothetical protein [Moraxella sp.]